MNSIFSLNDKKGQMIRNLKKNRPAEKKASEKL